MVESLAPISANRARACSGLVFSRLTTTFSQYTVSA
jgi:hypothetical protein